jgi:hypothetical protein
MANLISQLTTPRRLCVLASNAALRSCYEVVTCELSGVTCELSGVARELSGQLNDTFRTRKTKTVAQRA